MLLADVVFDITIPSIHPIHIGVKNNSMCNLKQTVINPGHLLTTCRPLADYLATTWLHLFDFSPLCIFKCILKTSAQEALPGENIGILLGFVEVVKGFHERLRPELASLSTFRQPSHPPVYHGDHDNDDSDDGDDDNNDDDNGDGGYDDDNKIMVMIIMMMIAHRYNHGMKAEALQAAFSSG